jgi:hypothetical protein
MGRGHLIFLSLDNKVIVRQDVLFGETGGQITAGLRRQGGLSHEVALHRTGGFVSITDTQSLELGGQKRYIAG